MSFQEVITRLEEISCLTFIEPRKKKEGQSKAYRLGHSRISFVVEAIHPYWTNDPNVLFDCRFFWLLKRKYKNSFRKISLLEVLEAPYISEEIKSELLFHLDLFLEKKT